MKYRSVTYLDSDGRPIYATLDLEDEGHVVPGVILDNVAKREFGNWIDTTQHKYSHPLLVADRLIQSQIKSGG